MNLPLWLDELPPPWWFYFPPMPLPQPWPCPPMLPVPWVVPVNPGSGPWGVTVSTP